MWGNYIKCCHNCEKREVGCHSWCEAYKEERAKLDALNQKANRQKMIENTLDSQSYEAKFKAIKRKGIRR